MPICVSLVGMTLIMFGIYKFIGNHCVAVLAISVVLAVLFSWMIILDRDERFSLINVAKSKIKK